MKFLYPTFIFLTLAGCSESPIPDQSINEDDSTPLDTTITILNTPIETQDSITSEDTITNLLIDTLIETDLSQNNALKHYLEYLEEEMQHISNPVKATYEGTDFGDYFHLTFMNSDGHYIDFADGNNNFGDYELYDPITFEEQKRYVGKTFEIHWEFKKSQFLCCDGEMEPVTAKTPSITSLKLID